MLVIISDIHLGDGTTAKSISPTAFDLFPTACVKPPFMHRFVRDRDVSSHRDTGYCVDGRYPGPASFHALAGDGARRVELHPPLD